MLLQHTWFPLIKNTLESLNIGKFNSIGMIYMYYCLYTLKLVLVSEITNPQQAFMHSFQLPIRTEG